MVAWMVLFTVLLAGFVGGTTRVDVTQLSVPSNPALTNTYTYAALSIQFELTKSVNLALSPSYDYAIAYNVSCPSGVNTAGVSHFLLGSDLSLLKSAPAPIPGKFLFQVPLVTYFQECELEAQVLDDAIISEGNSTTFGVTIQHHPPIYDYVVSSGKQSIQLEMD